MRLPKKTVFGENITSSVNVAGSLVGNDGQGVRFRLLSDPLGKRRCILKFGRVPDIGRQVVNVESTVIRLRPLLHFLRFRPRECRGSAGRLPRTAGRLAHHAPSGSDTPNNSKTASSKLAAVALLQFVGKD